jgi:hypothetical protein
MTRFEWFLQERHAEQYIGTKDCMIDDFKKWLSDLGIDEFIVYGEQFGRKLEIILRENWANVNGSKC